MSQPFDWTADTQRLDADAIRARLDIERVVGDRIELRRKGHELVGLCPFHDDRTPSLAVVTHKGFGFYKCHACGAGGDALRFIADFHQVDYAEALRIADGMTGSSPAPIARQSRKPAAPAYRDDCAEVLASWRRSMMIAGIEPLRGIAATLGLSEMSLHAIGVALDPRGNLAFPMHDGARNVVGIRIREPRDEGAAKWALTGSRTGIFIPRELPDRVETLVVCEGPTDTAAMLDILPPRWAAIGRAACQGGHADVVRLAQSFRTEPRIAVLADHDGPGILGAESLANALLDEFRGVVVFRPPARLKDARAWLRAGASPFELRARLDTRANHRRTA